MNPWSLLFLVVPWGAWEAPQVPNCKETKERLGAKFHRPFGT